VESTLVVVLLEQQQLVPLVVPIRQLFAQPVTLASILLLAFHRLQADVRSTSALVPMALGQLELIVLGTGRHDVLLATMDIPFLALVPVS
jgi:hypothetical protein